MEEPEVYAALEYEAKAVLAVWAVGHKLYHYIIN